MLDLRNMAAISRRRKHASEVLKKNRVRISKIEQKNDGQQKKWEHLDNHQEASISQESYNTIKKIKQNFCKSLRPETEYTSPMDHADTTSHHRYVMQDTCGTSYQRRISKINKH